MDKNVKSLSAKHKYSTVDLLKFIVPSIVGILLFMTPIVWQGQVTIPIAILAKELQALLVNWLPQLTALLAIISFIGSLGCRLLQPDWLARKPFLNSLFNVSLLWLIIRGLGAVFALVTLFHAGPEWVWSENTGQVLLFDLLPLLFVVFLLAGMLLPLLVNFGLLEFIGALMIKVMRPLFTLPGRSSIDCLTSWLGDGTIGVLLTSKQYESGYYTRREAAVIGTTFSAVSITFSFVVLAQVKLEHLFVPFYITVSLAGVVAALIMPRIPPLSRKPNTFYGSMQEADQEVIPKGYTPMQWGMTQAVSKARENTRLGSFIADGFRNILDLWIGVIPVVMAVGTLALILAEYTPVFKWLGLPFLPLLELMQLPEAEAASQTMVVGFADMFLPTVLASSIESELTRFVIAALSVTQLIYMSEVGGLLLGSKIPISLKDLFLIFIERTLITLPIIVVAAHLIF
ncbi:YjiH family protein [Paenibacillus sp. J2TS4]|uniref:YjiH family protein n=1 Tax=Paenibacillus sp. J2TS4 TaxID=2807194 RepID=UPI001B18D693|nr:YjiH family protein [Paenibacillus sp. J2TS4]GIP35776.1 membrane protein [Paenibacillus sp. J2TS4]